MSENFWEHLNSQLSEIRKTHALMADYYEKMLSDVPTIIPKIGDRVIVAAGLLNRGHLWIRKECVVIEVAAVSYKVRCTEKYDTWEEWIDRALIVDVLPMERTDAKRHT